MVSRFWRLEVRDQGVGRVASCGFSPALSGGWLSSACLHVAFPLGVCVLISSTSEDTSPGGLWPTQTASF